MDSMDFIRKNWLLILFSIFGNYWLYRIIKIDLLVALLMVVISFLLMTITHSKKSKLFVVVLLSAFLLLSFKLYQREFDSNIFRLHGLEKDLIAKRHEYYSFELGKLYRNRYGLWYFEKFNPMAEKYLSNCFSYLDYNLYFSGNHTQERPGIMEFYKYPLLLLPVFFVGLFLFLREVNIAIFLYFLFSIFVSGFINPGAVFGPVLMFPFINYLFFTALLSLKKLRSV